MNNQVTKETISIKIGLSGTYWDKKPHYSVFINDSKIADHTISGPSDAIEYVSFNCDLEEEKEHNLIIRLENKADSDTITITKEDGSYTIEQDMLLNIISISIDDIELETLLWTASKFVPDNPSKPELMSCVNLGWNGSYILNFRTPFYLWLLENM